MRHQNQHIRAPEYFSALDGIRGILALCVAIYHTAWYSHINSSAFLDNGAVVLDLFFVFSGFLMYRLYHDKLGSQEMARTFLKRRFARLYPIHIFMLALFALYAFARLLTHKVGLADLEPGEILPFQSGSSETVWTLFLHATLSHSIGLTDSLTFNYPSWTISTEVFAYAAFLLMFMRARPTRAIHFGLIGLGVGLIYWALSRVKPNMDITYDFGFWRCLAGFFVGVIASWIYMLTKDHVSRVPALERRWIMSGFEALAAGMFIGFTIYFPGKAQFFIAPIALFFVLTFAYNAGFLSRALSVPVLRHLGKISYSVYMTHTLFSMVIYTVYQRIFPTISTPDIGWVGDILILPYLAVVIAFSNLTYIFIERPGQKWIMKHSWHRTYTQLRAF